MKLSIKMMHYQMCVLYSYEASQKPCVPLTRGRWPAFRHLWGEAAGALLELLTPWLEGSLTRNNSIPLSESDSEYEPADDYDIFIDLPGLPRWLATTVREYLMLQVYNRLWPEKRRGTGHTEHMLRCGMMSTEQ